ncbi:formylglycine-generating enzyme family protein [Oceanihabitans sp. 2_MG-2023]|uniref:formylglycine-generating enzyme family protein n=1 Tax=Oceanihabitans sp. 2_MG-2023 TaxID=3062661 RepID=UPI0026E2EB8E|nr:formylglycine-generating enzyme family protein [Oceanihabitans sp. 2_MG-2023]MDO6597946.1 formylglycine-generating enzyme family protein [Oceanihabitans sp. 2_MG-2023]
MNSRVIFFQTIVVLLFNVSCKKEAQVKNTDITNKVNEIVSAQVPEKIPDSIPEGMVWIPGGTFNQGAVAQDNMAMQHEKPSHPVKLDGFFMDITEVTNAQFAAFVKATGYVTTAEKDVDWEEMKKQVPAGTLKPHDSILQSGSMTFKKTKSSVPNLYDFSQWWHWSIGANWKQPNGKGSSIEGKDNYPVVQVSYEDAIAYCKWANRRLPTEAEWEYAAQGGRENTIYFWGDDRSQLSKMANSWEGEFPFNNTKEDGYEFRAPVKSYPENGYGLFDMAGNVWEWTGDWYNTSYYKELASSKQPVLNPKGATKAFNPNNPYVEEKITKGGSFLCSDSYCASYRISSRMGTSRDSSLEHLGFRTVAIPEMLRDSL